MMLLVIITLFAFLIMNVVKMALIGNFKFLEMLQIMGASSWWSALDWQEKTDALAEIYVPRMLEAYKIQGTSSFDLMCVDIYRRFKDG